MDKIKPTLLLSQDEKAFFNHLKTNNYKTYFSAAIEAVVNNFSIERFRLLVCHLLEAYEDSKLAMTDIIGEEGIRLLEKLKS